MSANPVLYAEDDENDAILMERAFRVAAIRHRLEIVPTGTAAIEYLSGAGAYSDRKAFPLPQLVLLDLKLPGESGFDVLKWIRSQPAISTLPVVALTSSNQESDMQHAYLNGANGYLIKPGKPEDLVVMVKGIRDYWLAQNRTSPV
jgi:CheY-like chemotaxis protein